METLKRDLGAGKIHPVYLISGSEELLKREAVKAIGEAALCGSPKEFNETRLLWKETTPDAILDACRTFPMMGPKRYVLVTGLEKAKAAELKILAEYVSDPAPTTTLVIVSDKFDARSALVKRAKKVGHVQTFDPPYANRIPPWLQTRAREKGAEIDGAAASLLGDILGNDLVKLDSALERLILFAATEEAPRPRIGMAEVEQCIARARVHTVFELTDALGRRQTADALQILDAMLEARQQPIPIVAMIGRHLRRLWQAADALRDGQTEDDIGKLLRVHPYFLRDFVRQARSFRDADFARLLDRIYETDRSLKSSRVAPELHLHRLVSDVCAPQ